MITKTNSFFFSKILYKNIHSVPDSILGKLNDLVLDFSTHKPVVIAIEVKIGSRKVYVSADFLEIYNEGKESYTVKLNTDNLKMIPMPDNGFFLARNFLDKQIVDVDGQKIERVNDVRLGMIRGHWVVLAVDIGMRGLLRRMGWEYMAIRCSGMMKKEFRNKLLLWDNVQPLSSGISDLQLSTSMNKLTTLHVADIADIIEDLDKESQIALIHSLGDEKAAKVLEEMEEDDQVDLLKTLPDERASDLLEIMPSDEAADILENIEDIRAEKLLEQMEAENSTEIRELMEYEDSTIGSVMTKDFVAFRPDETVEEAICSLRENRPEEEISHYIYLVDEKKHLTGVVSLLDIAAAENDVFLKDLKMKHLYIVKDEERIDKVMELMQKYNLQAMPVTDEKDELVGITFLSDLIHEYVKLRRVPA